MQIMGCFILQVIQHMKMIQIEEALDDDPANLNRKIWVRSITRKSTKPKSLVCPSMRNLMGEKLKWMKEELDNTQIIVRIYNARWIPSKWRTQLGFDTSLQKHSF